MFTIMCSGEKRAFWSSACPEKTSQSLLITVSMRKIDERKGYDESAFCAQKLRLCESLNFTPEDMLTESERVTKKLYKR